jgi:DNA-binding winged helix-turn-helix (wHTH) protein
MTAAAALAKGGLLDLVSTGDRVPHADHRATLSFPPFRLDLAEERLWKGERELPLRRKPFAILRYLAQRPRRLITHAELVEGVWGRDTAMSESLLRTHMRDLRRALGEAVIETVVGRGYRFVAAVSGGACAQHAEGLDPGCLEPAQHAARGSVQQVGAGRSSLPTDAHVRLLTEVARALATTLGTGSAVVLVVGNMCSVSDTRGVAISMPASSDPEDVAPTS